MMYNDERRRHLDLAKAAPEAAKAIHEMLAAEPATYEATIKFQVRDPYLELGDNPSSIKVNSIITESVLAELSPEWFSSKWGAGWWIDKASTSPGDLTLRVIDENRMEAALIDNAQRDDGAVAKLARIEEMLPALWKQLDTIGEFDRELTEAVQGIQDVLKF
jgi:hypothetical protein